MSQLPPAGRGRGKRPADAAPLAAPSDRAAFYRDERGELVVLKPGEKQEVKEKTAEELHYEAYLEGKRSYGGYSAGGYSDGVDRAAATSSYSYEASSSGGGSGGGGRGPDRGRGRKMQKVQDAAALRAESLKSGADELNQALKRAREGSDDDGDGDDDAGEMPPQNAVQLCNRAMDAYNLPISNQRQADVHGNDLRLPQLERKLRKFLECFGEEAAVKTVDGKPVLGDYESMRKRYATVFRESGSELRGAVRRRWYLEVARSPDAFPSYCIDYERHTSLVTPRPGLPLDGSMGCVPPRTQDLVAVYMAEGGEIAGVWVAPDRDGAGADASLGREGLEGGAAFKAARALVERLSGGEELDVHFNDYVADGFS